MGMATLRIDAGDRGMIFTKGGVACLALKTVTTGDRPVEQYAVAFVHRVDIFSDGNHLTGAFVAENDWLAPRQRIEVCVADSGSPHAHQDLVGKWLADFRGGYFKVAIAIANDRLGVHDGR